jgi:hypothetical protein
MNRVAPIIAVVCALSGADLALAQAAAPCVAGCAEPPALDFTIRGGERDSLSIGRFTPRSLVEEPTRGVEAGVRAFGVDVGGALIRDGRGSEADDSLNLGAAYDAGSITFGGGVSLGLGDESGDSAGVGMRWRASDGLSLGSSLSIGEAAGRGADADPDLSAGVNMRLDF